MSPELETERVLSRSEIATVFREFADGLDGSGPITISIGGRSVTVAPPERLTFDVEVEDESRRLRRGERTVEFELEWKKTDGDEPIEG